ncbi:3-carboxy-cis,cis-muconate cycloisomerase [Saccharothrix sp. ALI-22-I]|uniref:lyase family protein n=1 Tax=Saccharothrix sp. ALI-22-I TaxID=1933778 RepID=UPI00097C607B|nr:lyase family protein [Saccharothrix sp. ALI-22-I]ONI86789.1 3-carboxy-cis,cis-muconate cycloisomerase [Saccharothrix sp. ALI-22-I]
MSLLSPVWAGMPVASLATDEAWLAAMVDVENALARAQSGADPVTVDMDVRELAVLARDAANPVVAFAARLPPHLHRGSTSQDILDSAAMLVTRRVVDLITADLERIGEALAVLADRHRESVMPGRTLGQHAVPTTFGLRAAGWLDLVQDAWERARALVLPAQLGGAAGTLAAYAEHPGLLGGVDLIEPFARELGLAVPTLPWHTLRTPIVDTGSVLQFVTGALGKIAVDVITLSRTEIGEVSEPVKPGRGASSAMPQKRNPTLSTLVLTAARQVPALVLVLAQSMIAEDDRPAGAWHAEWEPLRESLRLTGGATHTAVELVEGLVVHPDRMAANLALTGPAIVSERLAAALTPALGKAKAKDVLATAARTGTYPDVPPHLLDPAEYLGAADALVTRAVERWSTRQTDHRGRGAAGRRAGDHDRAGGGDQTDLRQQARAVQTDRGGRGG